MDAVETTAIGLLQRAMFVSTKRRADDHPVPERRRSEPCWAYSPTCRLREPQVPAAWWIRSDLGPTLGPSVRLDFGPGNKKGLRANTRNPSRKSSGGKI